MVRIGKGCFMYCGCGCGYVLEQGTNNRRQLLAIRTNGVQKIHGFNDL